MPEKASDLLPFISKESLQSMGRAWGLDVKNRNKEDLVDFLAEHFVDPQRISRAVESLAYREREALDLLILNGGRLSTNALRGQLESQGLVDHDSRRSGYSYGPNRAEGSSLNVDSRRFEDILARLGALGLAFPWQPADGGMLSIKRPGKAVVIPTPILRLLPAVRLTRTETSKPPLILKGSPDSLLRNLMTVVSAIRREPIDLTTRGLIPKRSLVKLARLLSTPETDLGYPAFLTVLARNRRMIVSAGGRLTEGSAQTASFLERPRGERLKQLYEAYASSPGWSELVRIPNVAVRGNTEGTHVLQARRRVLDVLGRYPAKHWVEIEHLVDLMRRTSYEFLIPRERNDPYGYYSAYPFNPYTDGNLRGVTFNDSWDEAEGWNRIEGGFVRATVIEALFWLGMLDLGAASPNSDPQAFLLNEVGAALLRGQTPELPQPASHVVVQPNFQIFAFEPTGEDVLFGLERLAERVSAQQAVEFRLTRDSIYQAQQNGMDVAEILRFLHEVSTVPIPQNVHRSVTEWAAQNDRVVIYRGASLLQTIDEATLDALYSRFDVVPLLGKRLAPTAALVPYNNLAALNALLTGGSGPMPVLSEGDDAQLGDAIRVGNNGTITFRGRLPSVYMQRRVGAVAEPAGDGGYRLTRASLRRAARNFGPDDIIRTLSHLQGYPLSDAVVALIHRWTKDWGGAALAEVLLLQVDSNEILEALLGAPDVCPYLQRLQGSSTCALVSREGLEKVRAALEERGMELHLEPATAQKR